MASKKLLLIGWDAADWQLINPLIKQGKMPALQRMIEKGVKGNIATLNPSLSPILWTSIATGKRAYDHGILGFVQPTADLQEVEPITSTSRKTKAIWNILNEAGYTTNVINWWPSHPAEKLKGVTLTNHFHQKAPAFGAGWPLDSSVVYPNTFYESLKELRLHPAELSLAHILPFVPEAHKLDPEKDTVLKNLMRILAHNSSIHNAATHLLAETEWDFTAVYYETLDHISHLAMKYHPPRQEGVDEREYERYKNIVEAAYRFKDMMLERLLDLAGEDCNVILLSDHGFQSGQQRQVELPDIPASPALEHRKYGIFIASGPDFKPGQDIYGTSLLDIAPTILHLFDLPVGNDMEGKVLTDSLKEKTPVGHIPSWELTPGKVEFTDSRLENNTSILQQLEQLGYIDLNQSDKVRYVQRELRYNLCQSLTDGNKLFRAQEECELLFKDFPDFRTALLLGDIFIKRADFKSFEDLKQRLGTEVKGHPSFKYLSGLSELYQGKVSQSLGYFLKIEEEGGHSLQLYNEVGRAFLLSGELRAAERYFDRSLALDAENAPALTGKAQCAVEKNDFSQAILLLDKSLQQLFYQPNAHYLMAVALRGLKKEDEAVKALQLCLSQAPKHRKALVLKQEFFKSREIREEITIVTGFPRSGTSLMMKMLEMSGYPVFTDEVRVADQHNPAGYLEHEMVKKLAGNTDWLKQVMNKAVKVVLPLLRYLPADYSYRLIWVKRPLTEVILSQEVMKGKDRQTVMQNFPFQLAADFQKEEERMLQWLQSQPNFAILQLEYYDCLSKPEEVLGQIRQFLDVQLNVEEGKKSVNKDLHRNKLGEY